MRSIPRSRSGRATSRPARRSSLASQFRPTRSTSCVSTVAARRTSTSYRPVQDRSILTPAFRLTRGSRRSLTMGYARPTANFDAILETSVPVDFVLQTYASPAPGAVSGFLLHVVLPAVQGRGAEEVHRSSRGRTSEGVQCIGEAQALWHPIASGERWFSLTTNEPQGAATRSLSCTRSLFFR